MERPTKRKAFNFLRSYFDVVNELQNDSDKCNFLMAIINKQFLDEDPKDLSFIVNLCYSSQKHSIEASVKGWKRVSNTDIMGDPPTNHPTNPLIDPVQEKEEVEVQEEVKEKVKVKEKEDRNGVFSGIKVQKPKIEFQEIIDIFNSVCKDLPKAQTVGEKRKTAIRMILKNHSLEQIGDVFRNVSESDFLNGRVTNFTASFDWILKPDNFIKILENNYKNNKNGNPNNNQPKSIDERWESINSKIDSRFSVQK